MSKRSLMFATEVRAIVAPKLRECPRECGIVTITRVDISIDASYATVYISALQNMQAALDFLNAERQEIQRRFSKMPRKKIPLLRFRMDDTSLKGMRIDQLLEEASKSLPRDTSGSVQG